MGRKVALLWHASFSIGAGVLYFFFVLPRWPELMGDTTRTLGTALRIVTGALIGLAALPVVFTQLRTRKPELGIPQLALSIRTWAVVAHVLSGVLIIGTAVSEIWLSLDAAGQYLFAIYGAAAALALLGVFGFYLSFVAELPPPPPKPIKAKKEKRSEKKPKKRGTRRKEDAGEAAQESPEETAEEVTESQLEAEPEAPDSTKRPAEPAPPAAQDEQPAAGLRNRRPTGKGSHRLRRRDTGGLAIREGARESREGS